MWCFAKVNNIRFQFTKWFCRENPHITKEEWELLRSMDMNTVNPPATPAQLVFLTALVGAVSRILNDLDIDVDLMLNQRIYCLQVFQLQFGVSFIIVSSFWLSLTIEQTSFASMKCSPDYGSFSLLPVILVCYVGSNSVLLHRQHSHTPIFVL